MHHHRPVRQAWESTILTALSVVLTIALFALTVLTVVDAYRPRR